MNSKAFEKVIWPITTAVVAGIFALHASCNDESHRRYESFTKAVENATAEGDSPVKRVAGIWQMNQFWDDKQFEQTMAATLTAAMSSDAEKDGLYRCAAAEVIGNAIDEKDGYSTGASAARSERIAHILYGDRSGELGIVSELNRTLAHSSPQSSASPKTCELTNDASALDATREAIRKNWKYLRAVNLNDTDLQGSPLYKSDLDSSLMKRADLRAANLRCANLRGVDLSDAKLEGANLDFANMKDVTPPTIEKPQRAQEMSSSDWERWRENKFRVNKDMRPILDPSENSDLGDSYPWTIDKPPHPREMSSSDWEHWRENKFRVDKDMRPILDPSRNSAPGDSYPCSQ